MWAHFKIFLPFMKLFKILRVKTNVTRSYNKKPINTFLH